MSSALQSDFVAACAYLLKLKSKGVSLGLGRMKQLLESIGNPQLSVPCIHIAGTNGKGSVAAMLEAMLRSSNDTVGLYTSPHLVRLGERVQVNRSPLTNSELVQYVNELTPAVEEGKRRETAAGIPSYFEFMTALAFVHFQKSHCAISCIEVGLGGRLDATNVVIPEVSVITSIGMDHCELLGFTHAEIAAEKGGIIKPGRPIVIGRLPPEAEEVIRATALQRGASVTSVVEEFGPDLEEYPTTDLAGSYQRVNAATATLALRALPARFQPSVSDAAAALLRVDWAARWQKFVVDGRTVILDSSHNEEGAGALEQNLRAIRVNSTIRPVIVMGVLGVGRARPLVEVCSRYARELHLVRPSQTRACSFEEMEDLIPLRNEANVHRSSVEQIFPSPGVCAVGQPGDVVVVTGSIYLAGEVLVRIDPARGPYEGHLQDF